MYMPYTTNPHLPKVRMNTVRLVRSGWSIRRAARYIGVEPSTVLRWVRRAPFDGRLVIPTQSSRPHHHPAELPIELVEAIIQYRIKYRRCAEVIHYLLGKEEYRVSLSSVKRVFRRYGLVDQSPRKKWHFTTPRPEAKSPGILVQIDTIHIGEAAKDRWYVYTILDVYSRWAHALVADRITTHRSLAFVRQAQELFPHVFSTLQSDHGSEFSAWFTEQVQKAGYTHRHSRVRMPSDNGHLERFNRTIQEECFHRVPQTFASYQKALPDYLQHYRTKRPHLALGMKTPEEVLRSY